MKREGRGPRELRDGKLVRITPAADAEWTAARESAAGGAGAPLLGITE
jgi:hypothetical protein